MCQLPPPGIGEEQAPSADLLASPNWVIIKPPFKTLCTQEEEGLAIPKPVPRGSLSLTNVLGAQTPLPSALRNPEV